MTALGESFAANPARGEESDALKVLYFARRRQGKITTEQVVDFIIPDKWQAQKTLNRLVDMQALQKIA
jgi:hypothetical protein